MKKRRDHDVRVRGPSDLWRTRAWSPSGDSPPEEVVKIDAARTAASEKVAAVALIKEVLEIALTTSAKEILAVARVKNILDRPVAPPEQVLTTSLVEEVLEIALAMSTAEKIAPIATVEQVFQIKAAMSPEKIAMSCTHDRGKRGRSQQKCHKENP